MMKLRRRRAKTKRLDLTGFEAPEPAGLKSTQGLLSTLSGNGELQRRVEACRATGDRRWSAALPILLEIAEHEADSSLMWDSIFSISQIGSLAAVRPLIRLLRLADLPLKRRAIIVALSDLRDGRSRHALTKTMLDGDEEVEIRGLAAEGLGYLRPRKKTFSDLLKVLGDASAEVRLSALCAIGNLRDPKAIPAVIPLLSDVASVATGETVAHRARVVLDILQKYQVISSQE